MERALRKNLIGKSHRRELLAHLRQRLPRLEPPASRSAWVKKTSRVRQRLLEVFFRGHPAGLLELKPRVQWTATIETGAGYRIRKLRYEGYPGMWVPALLYEPVDLRGKVPAVLNPNGHHPGGKAMDYKQARCINLAKRGMLALNTEFIGMGELRADPDHNRIALLDLCGIAGVGVFYLAMKRGLDVLLSHPHADADRIVMTGLSGGGWQTVVLSALDRRVTAVVPVAGHSPVWQRAGCVSDIGDMEQVPSDLCTVGDFDTLTALFAPRPTLLIYNRHDDCCFQTRRTRKSIYEPVKPIFAMLGASENLGFYDNVDPGTHNYESDNRSQFYKFLNRHFGLETPDQDLPWREELHTEAELRVGLPHDNATLLSLAHRASGDIFRARSISRPRPSARRARARLAAILKLPEYSVRIRKNGRTRTREGMLVRHVVLDLSRTWSLPVTEICPSHPRGIQVVINDGGRSAAAHLVRGPLGHSRRTFVADLFGTGEALVSSQYHMIESAAGERPLGLQVGQLNALIDWICKRHRTPSVHLTAAGQVMSVVALCGAALNPGRLRSLQTAGLVDTLHRLVDWPMPYAPAAPLFCFGLLKEFDVPDLISLARPVTIKDGGRGPLT